MAGKSNKGRKIDRNRKWCEAYRNRGQRELNKIRKLLRHFKRQGRLTDAMAVHCFNNLPERGKPAETRSLTPEKTLHKRIPAARPMRRVA